MHVFYTPDIQSTAYTLNEEESKHCIRVLRLTIGDKVILVDGKGGWYEAEIDNDNPKRCTVNIIQTTLEFGKRNIHLQIAIAPTKNMDRLEWFIEKAAEIGIDEISIIDCQNSERTIVKTERLKNQGRWIYLRRSAPIPLGDPHPLHPDENETVFYQSLQHKTPVENPVATGMPLRWWLNLPISCEVAKRALN